VNTNKQSVNKKGLPFGQLGEIKLINISDIIRDSGIQRLDVFVRCMYVEAILKNHSEEQKNIAGDLYQKMQVVRSHGNVHAHARILGQTTHTHTKHFGHLIDSFKNKGYLEGHANAIKCSEQLNGGTFVSDGAHRLSICLAYNFDKIPSMLIDDGIHVFEHPHWWVENAKFSKKEMTLIEQYYRKKRRERKPKMKFKYGKIL